MKKYINLNDLVIEEIDPFLGKDQLISVANFGDFGIQITLYYHDADDCLKVKIEQNGVLLYERMGARPTFKRIVSLIRESIEEEFNVYFDVVTTDK